MPQLTLEFSPTVVEKEDMIGLFQKCHEILVQTLPTELGSCKSRAFETPIFYIGDGDPNNAFVHVSLKSMPGRTVETLTQAGENLMKLFKTHLCVCFSCLSCFL